MHTPGWSPRCPCPFWTPTPSKARVSRSLWSPIPPASPTCPTRPTVSRGPCCTSRSRVCRKSVAGKQRVETLEEEPASPLPLKRRGLRRVPAVRQLGGRIDPRTPDLIRSQTYNPAEVGPEEVRPAEVGPGEVRPGEVRPAEVRPAEVGPAEEGPGEVRPGEVRPGEVRPAEVRPAEVRPAEVRPAEVRPAAEDLRHALESGEDLISIPLLSQGELAFDLEQVHGFPSGSRVFHISRGYN